VSTVVSEQGVLLQDRVVGGVTLTAGMTPTERFQALARSIEAGTFAPSHNGSGPPLEYQTHGTATRMAQGEKATAAPGTVAGKAPAPTPKQLEAANKPQGTPSAARQAELDAELQAKGLQKRPDGTTHADGQPDLEAAERLTARYMKLRQALKGPKAEQELREIYERDMKRILEGRPLTELELNLDPNPGKKKQPAVNKSAAPAQTAAPGWQSHIEDGQWVGLEHLTTAHTYGYSIPQYVKDQRVHVSVFDQLRDAKAAGVSQAQVNAVLHQHAVRNGWVKA
jgi:hypothetical protein